MKRQLNLGIAGCAAALLCTGALAQSTSSSPGDAGGTNTGSYGTASGSRSSTDSSTSATGGGRGTMPMRTASTDSGTLNTESFVKEASQAGMTEVEASKLAESKAQSSEVKSFAKRMVTDHTKADNELKSIASRKGIKVASALDSEHQSMIDNLRSKSGGDFDTAYKEGMASDHHKAVDLFQRAGSSPSIDSDVKSYAEKTLPTLEKHKQMADTLENGGSSSTSRSGSSTGEYGSRTDSSTRGSAPSGSTPR